MKYEIVYSAFGWGLLSAVSLPLGAFFGLWLRPGRKITSAMMAFGAGALLFALTIELFGETLHMADQNGVGGVLALVVGALIGGFLFEMLNQLLNSRGAFLRKFSTGTQYLARLRWMTAKKLIKQLGQIKAFQGLSPSDVESLAPYIFRKTFGKNKVIFQEGDHGEEMYFIISGNVVISREDRDREVHIANLKSNEVLGEMALLSDLPRTATAVAQSETTVWALSREDFNKVVAQSDKIRESLGDVVMHRIQDLSQKVRLDKRLSEIIANHGVQPKSTADIKKVGASAGLIIWLGLFLDGIPESLVIGMLAGSTKGMSIAFIVGVFMANFPEALSSSVSMKESGMKMVTIFMMWFTLTLITGLGAALGVVMFPSDAHGAWSYVIHGTEGVAAGAMLTMISETMLPEAYEQGGHVVGLSTLLGFLSALLVKVFFSV